MRKGGFSLAVRAVFGPSGLILIPYSTLRSNGIHRLGQKYAVCMCPFRAFCQSLLETASDRPDFSFKEMPEGHFDGFLQFASLVYANIPWRKPQAVDQDARVTPIDLCFYIGICDHGAVEARHFLAWIADLNIAVEGETLLMLVFFSIVFG